jgi:hypothetical protein
MVLTDRTDRRNYQKPSRPKKKPDRRGLKQTEELAETRRRHTKEVQSSQK